MNEKLDNETLKLALEDITEPKRVLTDSESLQSYGCDWTKIYDPNPCAVVLPKTALEVQAIVKLANEKQLALVPSGGRTGLSAGAVASNGEVVVAFDLMNRIVDFNPVDRTARCEAGVITEELQNYASEQGLFYPVDFASAGSSRLCGNIATNAGGIKVIRYGLTRDWVAGLKVVTGTGELLDLNKGLVKNATGFDLRHLFIGSEGVLGFIVEATMKLARAPKDLNVLVLGLPDMKCIMQVLAAFQNDIDISAFEFFSEKAVEMVTTAHDVQRPFATQTPFYALIEFEALSEATVETAMAAFEHCVEQGWVEDGVMSQSVAQAEALWCLREYISETISHYTPYKNDISVLVSKVPAFLTDVDAVVQKHYPDFDIVWFGHIGDGNLHLNILKPEAMAKQEFFEKCQQVNQWVFDIVEQHQGSVSAEHGVGMTKKPYLQHTRSAEELAYMQAIKRLFDPNNVMNPGKLVDPS